jgi:hypothetical protein
VPFAIKPLQMESSMKKIKIHTVCNTTMNFSDTLAQSVTKQLWTEQQLQHLTSIGTETTLRAQLAANHFQMESSLKMKVFHIVKNTIMQEGEQFVESVENQLMECVFQLSRRNGIKIASHAQSATEFFLVK